MSRYNLLNCVLFSFNCQHFHVEWYICIYIYTFNCTSHVVCCRSYARHNTQPDHNQTTLMHKNTCKFLLPLPRQPVPSWRICQPCPSTTGWPPCAYVCPYHLVATTVCVRRVVCPHTRLLHRITGGDTNPVIATFRVNSGWKIEENVLMSLCPATTAQATFKTDVGGATSTCIQEVGANPCAYEPLLQKKKTRQKIQHSVTIFERIPSDLLPGSFWPLSPGLGPLICFSTFIRCMS